MKIKDITGQRFGKLTVLQATNERKNRQVVWLCKCDCGNEVKVVGGSLRSGHTQSCGCQRSETKTEDLTNQHFGKLTVISKSDYKTKNRSIYWNCQCECGNTRIVQASDLRTNKVTECTECTKKNRIVKKGSIGPIKDLSGKRFGKLIVQKSTDLRDNSGHVIWECLCDCGETCYIPSIRLVTNNTMSCGCLRRTSHSLGETKIAQILSDNKIEYIPQYSFDDCKSPKNSLLRFDFAIIKDNKVIKLIEYDGEQHFQPYDFFGGEEGFLYLKEKDNIKNEYCKQHNIPLLRISYLELKDITLEKILNG